MHHIDCHGTGSAALALHQKNGQEAGNGAEPPRFVTASLKVDFVKPTPHGVPLKAVGAVQEIHPKKWKVDTEIFANDTLCARGEVVAVVMPTTFMIDSLLLQHGICQDVCSRYCDGV